MPYDTSCNPSLSADAGKLSGTSQQRGLLLALSLLIAGWLVAYVLTIWSLRQSALDHGLSEAARHARNFELQLTQTLETIEMAALGLGSEADLTAPQGQFSSQLKRLLNQTPYLRSISLIDAEGMVMASSSPENIGTLLPSLDLFPPAAANDPLLRIGLPVRGRDLYKASLPDAAHPLIATDPYFLPVVRQAVGEHPGLRIVTALNPDYFVLHFQQMLPSTEGFIQLLRQDGQLLISTRPDDAPAAERPAGTVHDDLEGAPFGTRTQTLANGFAALSAFRGSSRYPALIVVHLDQLTVLQRWQAEIRRLSLIVFPVLVALTVAILLIWRRQKRLEAKERELLEQRLLAASLFEATSDAVLITTPGGQILSSNPAFERMSGYSADAVRGRNPRLLASGEHGPDFFENLWHQVNTTGHWQGEIVNRHQDGHLFHNLLTINAVAGPDGETHHLIGVAADITQLKAHEAELQAARDRAEAASHAKSVFLATMSHELRTPMHGVMGMTELLLRSSLSERQHYQLGVIRSSAERLLAVLEQLLDFTDFEARGISLFPTRFNPHDLLQEVAAEFAESAQRKSLDFTQSTAADVPTRLTADSARVKQVVRILLSNAIKFTEQGGIECLATWDRGGRLRLVVRDTGIGIAASRQSAIFEPFTQIEDAANRRFGGLGLGLALARRLVAAMGGELAVNSTPGEGSCFTVRIPCPEAERA